MPNHDARLEHFCHEVGDYVSHADRKVFDIPEGVFQETSSESLTLVKKTQIKVGREIQKLLDSGKDQERLLNLYVIDRSLYELHHNINKAEVVVAENLCKDLTFALKHKLETIEKNRVSAERRFQKQLKWNDRIRIFCYLISMVCAVAGFAYPENTSFYLSIVLLCFTQGFLIGDIWMSKAKKRRDAEFQANDPLTVQSALKFLSAENLIILLEPPSFAPEYLECFFKMLIDLALSLGWIPEQTVDIEDVAANGKAALADAYSLQPTTFDAGFIKRWRKAFEKIQHNLRHRFGDSLYHFNQSAHRNPFFYLEQYALFKKSEVGSDVRRFLKQTEFL